MSIGDLIAKTLVVFQADTTSLKAGLKELQGEEKKLAEAQLAAANQRNTGLQSWMTGLAKANVALAGVSQVVSYAEDAVKNYGEQLRLQAAAGVADVDALSDSFNGLITRHQALTFAAQAQHGVLKLSEDKMRTVGQATVALTRAGFDQQEVYQKLTDAVIQLKTRGLDDLGISVKDGANNTETLNNIMDALNKKVQENSDLMETEAERVQRASTGWQDFKDSLAAGTAQLVLAVPSIEEGTKQLALLDKFWDDSPLGRLSQGATVAMPGLPSEEELRDHTGAISNAYTHVGEALDGFGSVVSKVNAEFSDYGEIGNRIAAWSAKTKKSYDEAAAAAHKFNDELKALSNQAAKQMSDELIKKLENELAPPTAGQASPSDFSFSTEGTLPLALEDKGAEKPKFLENLFGKPDQIAVYKEALTGLFDDVASGLDAMIVGGDAASKSFAAQMGSILHSVAIKEMTMGFALEGEAVADLITGNIPKAGADAAAGAKYLATGAAIDVVAKGLGYSGNSSSSAGGSGGGGASSGGGGGGGAASSGGSGVSTGQQKQVIVVYSNDFAEQSARQKSLQAQNLVNMALGAAGWEDS